MIVGALIPCRKGSKGIPNKNFKLFNGKPLVDWTLDAAEQSKLFSKIIVSSDGGARHLHDRENGVTILDNKRPREFAGDDAKLDPLLWHYAERYPDVELWCLLQPSSPLRTVSDIKNSFKLAKLKKNDSVVSVVSNPCFCWIDNAMGVKKEIHPMATYHPYKRPNRQDRKDWYLENGAIYWTKRFVLEQTGCRLGGSIGLYPMSQATSLEIDEPLDWFIAEQVGAAWVG